MAKLTVDINVENLDTYKHVLKDRLDFGFDSIYFRYAEVVDELSWLKLQEMRKDGIDFNRKLLADGKKMHFYACLEQLLRAHEGDNNDFK